ncbi:hypothetical protein HDV00_006284 [Rhizophlyctis rosea]|nr:hypothetical protein HDV00_006284 [Rhizophlyctis rosea]
MMNLPDEALMVYDELEAAFFQTLAEQGAPWFSAFGGKDPGDDSADILNLRSKPYREAIMQNAITIFDFRIYLFGRQQTLLMKLEQPLAMCQRAKLFITQMARTIQEHPATLVPHFCESWVYSSSLSVISHTDELVASIALSPESMKIYEGLKADLLQQARTQLDALGVAKGLLPYSTHASLPTKDIAAIWQAEKDSASALSNDELKTGLESEAAFDDLYMRITRRAVKCFESSGRVRSIIRKRLQEAAEMWETMVYRYSENGWFDLDAIVLEKLSDCQKQLGQLTRYVESCLYLAANPSLLEPEQVQQYVDDIAEIAKKMENGLVRENDSIFHIEVTKLMDRIGDDDGVVVLLAVQNNLPKAFHLDQINLVLSGGERTAVPGEYRPDRLKLQVGKLQFRYILRDRRPIFGESITSFVVRVHTGHNNLKSGTLHLIPLSGFTLPATKSVAFKTISHGDDSGIARERTIDSADGRIVLPSCHEDETLEFLVPFTVDAAKGPVDQLKSPRGNQVKLVMHYTTGDDRRRLHGTTETVRLPLPLQIAHSVFNVNSSTLVQFAVSATDEVPVRVTSIDLPSTASVECKELVPFESTTLFKSQEMSLLYRTKAQSSDASATPSRNSADGSTLQFTVRYHSVADEIDQFVQERLLKELQSRDIVHYRGFIAHFVREHITARIDGIKYAMLGEMAVEGVDASVLRQAVGNNEEIAVVDQLWSVVEAVQKTLHGAKDVDVKQEISVRSRTLIFRLEPPVPKAIITADVRPASPVAQSEKVRYQDGRPTDDPIRIPINLVALIAGRILLPHVVMKLHKIDVPASAVCLEHGNAAEHVTIQPNVQSPWSFIKDVDFRQNRTMNLKVSGGEKDHSRLVNRVEVTPAAP